MLVAGVLLANMITFVVRSLAMDQVMLKPEGIIRLDGNFVFEPASAKIMLVMRRMMVDLNNHPSDLVRILRHSQNVGDF